MATTILWFVCRYANNGVSLTEPDCQNNLFNYVYSKLVYTYQIFTVRREPHLVTQELTKRNNAITTMYELLYNAIKYFITLYPLDGKCIFMFCSSHILFFILSVNEANQYRKQLRPMSRAEADVNNIYTIFSTEFLRF